MYKVSVHFRYHDDDLVLAKGQIISKGLFGILEFFQKTNERILFYYCWAKNPNLFVCFLEESSACKKHYDSVWTLSNLHEKMFSPGKFRKS
jgi:hypothetical protein